MLAEGIHIMDLTATVEEQATLSSFIRLLQKWNRVYNLTSIANPEDMIRLHLFDSLSLLPYLNGTRILDVGTGAGLPGLPLAVISKDKQFTLLDSNAKKIRFVRQATLELGLSNVNVEQVRIEQYQTQQGFDCILARAFASISDIVRETVRLLNPGGVILAQKGKYPHDEINSLKNAMIKVFPVQLPGIAAERHLVEIKVLN